MKVKDNNNEAKVKSKISKNNTQLANFEINLVNTRLLLKVIDGLSCSYCPSTADVQIVPSARKSKGQEERKDDISEKLHIKDSKEKDIVVIIDDSEKHEDKLDRDKQQITLKMDGFEKVHLEQYEKILEQYRRFLAEYLKEAQNAFGNYDKYNAGQDSEDKEKRNFNWGQEVITYKEVKDIARRIHMNALMSGDYVGDISGHNSVGWQENQEYKFWKYASKFNELMSFILYDSVGSGG
jgi:hypothetical protein